MLNSNIARIQWEKKQLLVIMTRLLLLDLFAINFHAKWKQSKCGWVFDCIYNQKNKELFNWIVGEFQSKVIAYIWHVFMAYRLVVFMMLSNFKKTERENSLNLFTKQKHLNSNYLIPVVIKSEKQSWKTHIIKP